MSNQNPDTSKLPKWAQEHITSITRQLEAAQSAIVNFTANQTPSPFFLDGWYNKSAGKQFIQSPTRRMTAHWAGIHLEVYLAPEDDGQRPFGIELQYSSLERSRLGVTRVGIIPTGTNTVALVCKDNMR